MLLKSTAFPNGGRVPRAFTCDGANSSPPFAWTNAPPATQSFALVCRDPDAPGGTWYHWAIYDLPADCLTLPEGQRATTAPGLQAINDFGKRGYGGPCPPHGHGDHHYHFTLYAIDSRHLDIRPDAHCSEIERAAAAHVLATAELTGVYGR